MDGKRRGGGFLKRKLRSLYRATSTNKSPPSSTAVYNSKVSPSPNPVADQGGYMAALKQQDQSSSSWLPKSHKLSSVIVNQDQVTPQFPNHYVRSSVSYYLPPPDITTSTGAVYGGAVDEAIDIKAANYISSVQERFRLEYLN